MNIVKRLKSSRDLQRSIIFQRASIPPTERSQNSTARCSRIHIPLTARSSLPAPASMTDRLEKSLKSIRNKKLEITLNQRLFIQNLERKRILRHRVNVVDQRFRKAAIVIQRVVRGFLVRKRYRPLILEHARKILGQSLKSLTDRVRTVWRNLGNLNEAARAVQKVFRGMMGRKRSKEAKEQRKRLETLRNQSAKAIQRAFRLYLLRKRLKEVKVLQRKLREFIEKSKIARVKRLWEKCKFGWRVIRRHYGDYSDIELEKIPSCVVIKPLTPEEPKAAETKPKRKCRKITKAKLKKGRSDKSSIFSRSSQASFKEDSNLFAFIEERGNTDLNSVQSRSNHKRSHIDSNPEDDWLNLEKSRKSSAELVAKHELVGQEEIDALQVEKSRRSSVELVAKQGRVSSEDINELDIKIPIEKIRNLLGDFDMEDLEREALLEDLNFENGCFHFKHSYENAVGKSNESKKGNISDVPIEHHSQVMSAVQSDPKKPNEFIMIPSKKLPKPPKCMKKGKNMRPKKHP